MASAVRYSNVEIMIIILDRFYWPSAEIWKFIEFLDAPSGEHFQKFVSTKRHAALNQRRPVRDEVVS